MNNTNRKTISFILSSLTILAGIWAVFSAVMVYYEMPMDATIHREISLSIYVDGNSWTNFTGVSFGTLAPGSGASKNISILNTGNIPAQVTAVPSGLPEGWDLIYDKNGTIVQVSQWLNGTITLQTSDLSEDASYFWKLGIYASG